MERRPIQPPDSRSIPNHPVAIIERAIDKHDLGPHSCRENAPKRSARNQGQRPALHLHRAEVVQGRINDRGARAAALAHQTGILERLIAVIPGEPVVGLYVEHAPGQIVKPGRAVQAEPIAAVVDPPRIGEHPCVKLFQVPAASQVQRPPAGDGPGAR